ncbi:MAG: YncE family protein, partial [candidate division WOR-3 bacterium]
MKKYRCSLLILSAICLLFPALIFSQWLETTIYLPDTMVGVDEPQHIIYNPANNAIYVGSEESDCVLVIDGTTDEKTAKIPLDGGAWAMGYNSQNNKIYCCNDREGVYVIDGATNKVIATVTVGTYPIAFCHNERDNKVYCANNRSDNVTVIDGETNEVLATVSTGARPVALCYNPQ